MCESHQVPPRPEETIPPAERLGGGASAETRDRPRTVEPARPTSSCRRPGRPASNADCLSPSRSSGSQLGEQSPAKSYAAWNHGSAIPGPLMSSWGHPRRSRAKARPATPRDTRQSIRASTWSCLALLRSAGGAGRPRCCQSWGGCRALFTVRNFSLVAADMRSAGRPSPWSQPSLGSVVLPSSCRASPRHRHRLRAALNGGQPGSVTLVAPCADGRQTLGTTRQQTVGTHAAPGFCKPRIFPNCVWPSTDWGIVFLQSCARAVRLLVSTGPFAAAKSMLGSKHLPVAKR
jgi:hypothetical protein